MCACANKISKDAVVLVVMGWLTGLMPAWMDGWMDEWMDGWMDGWIDGWMDGWMDGSTKGHLWLSICLETRDCVLNDNPMGRGGKMFSPAGMYRQHQNTVYL